MSSLFVYVSLKRANLFGGTYNCKPTFEFFELSLKFLETLFKLAELTKILLLVIGHLELIQP